MCLKRRFIIESTSYESVDTLSDTRIYQLLFETFVNLVCDEYIDRMQVCFLEQRYVPWIFECHMLIPGASETIN